MILIYYAIVSKENNEYDSSMYYTVNGVFSEAVCTIANDIKLFATEEKAEEVLRALDCSDKYKVSEVYIELNDKEN